jgi:uncharacterized membrane protein YfcA
MRLSVILLCSAFACTSLEVKRAGPKDEGLRFNRPWPYLWVTSAANGGCTVQVLWLPRTDEEYVVRATAGLGSVIFKPVLTDGWNLTSLDGQVDSKAAEVLTAIGGIAGALVGKKAATAGPGNIEVGLYLFEFKDGVVAGFRHIWPEGAMQCRELAAPPKDK